MSVSVRAIEFDFQTHKRTVFGRVYGGFADDNVVMAPENRVEPVEVVIEMAVAQQRITLNPVRIQVPQPILKISINSNT